MFKKYKGKYMKNFTRTLESMKNNQIIILEVKNKLKLEIP